MQRENHTTYEFRMKLQEKLYLDRGNIFFSPWMKFDRGFAACNVPGKIPFTCQRVKQKT